MAKATDNNAVPDNTDDEKTVGSQDLANSDSEDIISSRINEGSLLRKLDIHLLPAVGILYLLSFLDRSNGMMNHGSHRAGRDG
jgi:hypothetical protein